MSTAATIVLLHGLGGVPESMFPIRDALLATARKHRAGFLIPRAKGRMPECARVVLGVRTPSNDDTGSWFGLETCLPVEHDDECPGIVDAWKRVEAQLPKDDSPVVLIGYSQGAGFALFATRYCPRVGACVAIHGRFPTGANGGNYGKHWAPTLVTTSGDDPLFSIETIAEKFNVVGLVYKLFVSHMDTHHNWSDAEIRDAVAFVDEQLGKMVPAVPATRATPNKPPRTT